MSKEKPFRGLAFCCTGIPSKLREEIAEYVGKLGGRHYSDLMSDVNYLIVGSKDTDKYAYCVRNRYDIKFITQESVMKVYEKWLKGDDVVIDDHRLPIFHDMTICLSRIDLNEMQHLFGEKHREANVHSDFFNLNSLKGLIEKEGGEMTNSLTTSHACIVTSDRKGKRYQKAKEWGIPIVHPIWLFDSYLRSMSLVLEDYSLDSKSLNGCNVWSKIEAFKEKKSPEDSSEVSSRSKSKLKSGNGLWNSIMRQAKTNTKENHLSSAWDEDMDEDTKVESTTNKSIAQSPSPQKYGLFKDSVFLLVGFTNRQLSLIKNVIESHDGNVCTKPESEITHIVIPAERSAQCSLMLRLLPSRVGEDVSSGKTLLITEWFIERSIYYNKITRDSWAIPQKGLVRSSRAFKVCITGFTGIELLHVEKLITYMGLEYHDTLTAHRDLLIVNICLFEESLKKSSPSLFNYSDQNIINCPTYKSGNTSVSMLATKNKINAAKQWKIPVVSIAYLWEALQLTAASSAANLRLPDLTNYSWCLYVVADSEKAINLMEYSSKKEEVGLHKLNHSQEGAVSQPESPHKRKQSDSREDVLLPSPRRNSKKRRYGRLSGNVSPNPDTQGFLNVEGKQEQDIDNFDEEPLTQVQYGTADENKSDLLIEKLSSKSKSTHRTRRRR